jgi:MFS family permease
LRRAFAERSEVSDARITVVHSYSEPKVFYGWIIAALAVFSVAVTNGISGTGISAFYHAFIDEFGWSRAAIATAGTLLLLLRGFAGPFTGPLWDRYGPKRFMVVGAAVIGIALLFGYFINKPSHLYLMLLMMSVGVTLAGLGAGTFLVSNWFTRTRGVAMGILFTGTSLGGMIFPPVSTYLISAYGWRVALVVYACFSFAVLAPLIYFFMKNRPADCGVPADPHESDLFLRYGNKVKSVAGVAAILGALIYSPVSSFLLGMLGRRFTILIFAVLGVICLSVSAKYFATKTGFLAAPKASRSDPVEGAALPEALASHSYWKLLLGSALCYYTINVIVQQFMLSLQSPQVGFSPADAAWAYSTLFFYSLMGKSLLGYLSDRFPKRAVNLISCALMCVGTLILLEISRTSAWFFCLVFGLGYGGVTVTTKLVLAELFGLRSLGKLLGIMTGAEAIFGGGGNLLTGRLFDATGSYEAAFKVMAACSIASVILMAMLGRRPPAWSLRPAER